MAQLIVRNLEGSVKTKLPKRAAANGRSMEEEIRAILPEAARHSSKQRRGLGTVIASRFASSDETAFG